MGKFLRRESGGGMEGSVAVIIRRRPEKLPRNPQIDIAEGCESKKRPLARRDIRSLLGCDGVEKPSQAVRPPRFSYRQSNVSIS